MPEGLQVRAFEGGYEVIAVGGIPVEVQHAVPGRFGAFVLHLLHFYGIAGSEHSRRKKKIV